MDKQACQAYLESQVMTATPQKLRLMLIDGAIRLARKAVRYWQAEQNQQALKAITRCRKIVSELLSSIRLDQSELTKQAAMLYLSLYKQLTEAQLRRDSHLVHEAIVVLEVERKTWQQVCDEMSQSTSTSQRQSEDLCESIAPMIYYPDVDTLGNGIGFDA